MTGNEAKKNKIQEERYDVSQLKRAILVGAYESCESKEKCMEFLTELEDLANTYGFEVVGKVPCVIRKFDARTYIGKGKVEEIAEACRESGIDLVIFDDEISPNQQRNLEGIIGRPVLDRTELILEVFAQRAQSKEARLQIELARSRYQLPRLKGMWTHHSRQTAGGGGATKGEGEKQIEIDRRLLKSRIALIQKEIKKVKSTRLTQRKLRERTGVPTFAIIGYTNAGKSTLLNALTDAEVLAEDKLFATLDTSSRQYTLPNHQQIVLVDTVGFIRKLPHTLVAAFRSTLEEAIHTDFILHVIDASHPQAIEQGKVTLKLLKELGSPAKEMITIFNKIDQVEGKSKLFQLKLLFSNTVAISAQNREGFDELLEKIEELLSSRRVSLKLRIPQKSYAVVAQLMEEGTVKSSEYEENDVLMDVEIPTYLEHKVAKYIEK
ncbi:MAG: GTPase HflX [Chlamydiia bacterium]|nr:GTPase HflX [Chlamydiia bacterium]